MERLDMGLLKFAPIVKDKIWGREIWHVSGIQGSESRVAGGEFRGEDLSGLLKKYGSALVGGKVYAQCGDMFPLLAKVIEANDKLSIQVHPNDDMARKVTSEGGVAFAKDEMWYVLDANNGAYLIAGFVRQVGKEEYIRRVKDGTLEEVLHRIDVKKGDVIYIPSGCVHAIGAGCRILEVQQSSDTTYRIYDYNRRDAEGNFRELHTDRAKEAINLEGWENDTIQYDLADGTLRRVIDSPHFKAYLLEFSGERDIDLSGVDSCVLLSCLEGDVDGLKTEETVLIPADEKCLSLSARKKSRVLLVWI